jgi:aspartyl-tRNA(Asn)/glutamyl-tRNA(Gln) amidotransferase subunit B
MTWETVIGLEVHVELATASKIFCGCPTAFGGEANSQCCPVCAGLPGALPVLNCKVVEFAVRACLATGCQISRVTRFDRKNYFYPDLPKAYQISQLHQPIGLGGRLEVGTGQGRKVIRIREIHMEEDAGKLLHDPWEDCTLIDVNRCGVPLLEIVSEPDLRSAEEALQYLDKLREILQFIGVSDCRMQEGSLRADVNVSVRPAGSADLGTRTEIKNMNSFKAIGRAIAAESRRQSELLAESKPVRQETRRWDENKDASFAMRSKEDAQDYRYFPDPDLPAVEIGEAWIAEIQETQSELPENRRLRYQAEWNLSAYEAAVLTSHPALAGLLDETVGLGSQPKDAAGWIMGEVLQLCKEKACDPQDLQIRPDALVRLIGMVSGGEINRATARQVFFATCGSDEDPVEYARARRLGMVGNPAVIQAAIDKAIRQFPKPVADIKAGKEKAFAFLVGQVMRSLQGQADPASVNRLLRASLQPLLGESGTETAKDGPAESL